MTELSCDAVSQAFSRLFENSVFTIYNNKRLSIGEKVIASGGIEFLKTAI